ncbi:MAG: hypothetical protein KO254_08995 [Methanoculleus marisnigri]|nr:hypothetical protein [Methanoculleus marisnigri]
MDGVCANALAVEEIFVGETITGPAERPIPSSRRTSPARISSGATSIRSR